MSGVTCLKYSFISCLWIRCGGRALSYAFLQSGGKSMTGRRIMLPMEFLVIRIPYISIMRLTMMTDDRVRLVYFDEK